MTKLRRTHNLLRHHQIVSLRSVDTFLTLNRSHAKLSLLNTANSDLTNRSDASNSGTALSTKVLDVSRPILVVLARNLGTVAFEANHTSTYTYDGILILATLIARRLADAWARSLPRVLAAHQLVVLSLVSETSDHHVGRLRRVGGALSHDTVR